MSTLSLAVRDSSTMLRRNLLHARRYPSLTLNLLLTPIMLLLLFVYIFGDAMSAGIGGGGGPLRLHRLPRPGHPADDHRQHRRSAPRSSVSTDMTEGIIARFRTMAIHRGSVLVGHVVGSVLQSVVSVVLVGAVAVAIGFRSTDATVLEWLAAFGLLALFALALTWIAVGMGLVSPNAEAASNNADAADPAAAHLQRLRPGRRDAGLVPADRRVPAVHPGHRDPARPAARHRDRQQRVASPSPGASASPSLGYLWAKKHLQQGLTMNRPNRAVRPTGLTALSLSASLPGRIAPDARRKASRPETLTDRRRSPRT